MARDLQKYAEQGKRRVEKSNRRYGLTIEELTYLDGRTNGDAGALESIATAYYAGVEAGYRMKAKEGAGE